MKKILLLSLILLINSSLLGQSFHIDRKLDTKVEITWSKPMVFSGFNGEEKILIQFESGTYNFPSDSLPIFSKTIYLPAESNNATADIEVLSTEPLTIEEKKALINNNIPSTIVADVKVTWYRKKPIATLSFHPIYKDPITGELIKVTSFNYQITPITSRTSNAANWNFKVNSVLRYGNWVKVGLTKDGIYKISYNELQSMGINAGNLNSAQIRVFGNGGGYLPFDNAEPRFDDLEENSIEVNDGGDGTFNQGDYFLFYGQGPNLWKYTNGRYNHVTHLFSDTTYYFITTDYNIGTPKRIIKKAPISNSADLTLTDFNDHQYHEVDLVNFVKSGRNWYGESFSFTKEQSFPFSFPNAIGNTAEIKARMAFRVIGRPSTFSFNVGNDNILNISHPGSSAGPYAEYAGIRSATNSFNIPSDNFSLDVNFSNPSSSDNGWIDYIEILCDRNLTMNGNQMPFRNEKSLTASVIQYNLSNLNNTRIWNVTAPTEVSEVSLSGNSFKEFGGQINEFVAFNTTNFLSVKNFGKVTNQDLHSIQTADYVIVTHPNFINQANQLAEHHRTKSNLNTVVVTTQQLYNEFSSGSQDITAIKSFNKMLYDRAGNDPSKMLKYVLLLGDASYDYKNRNPGNTNFIPAYQSANSRDPLFSYVSDDYVGFLDDNESDLLSSTLDVGIGRIVASTATQAQDVIDKTIHYLTNPACMRPWRNKIAFVGDDENGVIHMEQSDTLATRINRDYPKYNQNKIYLDAYQQVSNAGGSTYPDVNIALDKATETGSMIINYVGHGGELGLAHERILGVSQIKGYQNIDALALYVTATCEFSRFDDPERTSAGEFVLLNPNGAGLALLTTTRLVYSQPNFELTKKFFAVAFEKIDGEWPKLGDLLRISKVGGSNINTRNFSLLGDPAAQLAYPEYSVMTTSVSDTIKSLQKVTISGSVTNEFGQKQTNFNGVVYPTIYGQSKVQSTLNNDANGVMQFETQNNALFNGKASVTNGDFEFTFIVPKDINFKYGSGKISYYAENGIIDASDSYNNFQIGGRVDSANEDNIGPTVNLWMNDESFIIGGMTDQNPMIYAKVFDENGINTVGNGIGHDIVAVIDENTANSITLNDYYESELNSYQKGTVSYNLSNLSEGKHTLRLKVWDVYNNSGEGVTEFYVSNSSGFNIEHVLNYPNPFTTNTDFYFDHNAIGQQLEVRIQVFTISGKLVKTIDYIDQGESYRAGPINWNGKDDFGDRIGKGTYIYKVKVTNAFGQSVEKFEKIVIL